MQNNQSLVLIGSTGLTGKALINSLPYFKNFVSVVSLARKKIDTSAALTQYICDFNSIDSFQSKFTADAAVCCLGTTIKTAGSKEAFWKVDYEYVLKFAHVCKNNGVKTFVLQSSIGADAQSSTFYLQTKGKIEEELQKLNFEHLVIFRPSVLDGDREEFRLGEKIGLMIIKLIGGLMLGSLKKYKATPIDVLAHKMLQKASFATQEIEIIENDKIIGNE